MLLSTNGFDTGNFILPWSTTLVEALTQLAELEILESDHYSAKFPATHVFGLDILSVTLRAPAMDRPVMQVWYELKHNPDNASDDDLLESASRVFGPPVKRTNHDISRYPNPSSGVRSVARWVFAGFGVGLSIYGAPRETPEGLSPAALYVDWEDEIAAAAAYIHEMDEAERSLQRQAGNAEIIGRETLEKHQQRYHLVNYNNLLQTSPSEALLRAQRCLRKRHLYQTPAVIADSMQTNQVILWKNVKENIWCLSTKYETVCFPLGAPVRASHVNLLPAKGSGGSYLAISDLDLVSIANSPAIYRLVAVLQENLFAEIDFIEEYDI